MFSSFFFFLLFCFFFFNASRELLFCVWFHRISNLLTGWSWKRPLECIWPNPLLKQGHLGPVAQDYVQMVFEYLQGRRLYNHSGQPVPVLSHPHSTKMFPDLQRDLSGSQFVPIALVMALGTTLHFLYSVTSS